jgi:putative nucleotidyltransferase with HDIG domain
MQKEKILVIDDEHFILQLARDILTMIDYDVRTVTEGNKGIELLDGDKFDLLLTDIKMPDMDGLEVIRHVRTKNKEIPIIVITGHGTLDTAINALRLGAQGFILKPFTPAELRAAVAEALEKTRLLSENIRMRTLMPLFEVSKEIITEIDPRRLLGLIMEIALTEIRADRAYLCLIDEATGKFGMRVEYGLSSDFLDFREKYGEEITKFILEEGKPLLVSPETELPPDLHQVKQIEGTSYSIYMPLTIQGKIIGILYLGRADSKQPYSPSEVEFVSVLSGQAAAALENARLYEKLEQSYLSMIVTLSSVVEARDLYTDNHMKDIAEYSVDIAKKLGLPETEVENIRKAALLHDLGKVTVPDKILLKPDKLSEDEMDVIRKHPVNGAKIIEAVEPIKHAREIIRHHHESYDGSGYPDGLKGTDIPLGARIIAVADAFGAMTTDRPYRKALSVDEAMRELVSFAGAQFDPDVVSIFISILRERGIL